MKKILFVLLLLPTFLFADRQIVNVYNWTGYIPDSVLSQFTQETGIKVNYLTYGSNEELYAKIAASNNQSGYDLIVPSTDFLARMKAQGYLQKMDKTKVPNFKNINPKFTHQIFDPQNDYSIPYMWGTTSIVVNRLYFPNLKIDSWADLWNPDLKDQLLILDEARTPFAMAMKVLGYDINTRDPVQVKAAYEKLVQLLPNIKLFNIIAPQAIYANGDATIGVGYSGDTYLAIQNNPTLEYIYPKEGPLMWIDSMAIPMNAPHLDNAYTFINFILRPDIAAKIAVAIGYSTPNAEGYKLLPKAMQDNYVLYPSADKLKNASFQNDLGPANVIYQYYWQLLKVGG